MMTSDDLSPRGPEWPGWYDQWQGESWRGFGTGKNIHEKFLVLEWEEVQTSALRSILWWGKWHKNFPLPVLRSILLPKKFSEWFSEPWLSGGWWHRGGDLGSFVMSWAMLVTCDGQRNIKTSSWCGHTGPQAMAFLSNLTLLQDQCVCWSRCCKGWKVNSVSCHYSASGQLGLNYVAALI